MSVSNVPNRLQALSPRHIPGEPASLRAYRQRHADEARNRGLPGRGVEAWKYTQMRLLDGVELQSKTKTEVEPVENSVDWDGLRAQYPDAYWLALLNGRFVSSASRLPHQKGVHCRGLASAIASGQFSVDEECTYDAADETFAAINSAQFQDGLFIEIDDGVVLDQPLFVLHHLTGQAGAAVHERNIIRVGRDSRLSLIERTVGADSAPNLSTVVTQVQLSPQAEISHVRVQTLGARQYRIRRQDVKLAEGSTFKQVSLELGGAVVRNDEAIDLSGAGSSAALHGLYLVDGRRHTDNHLVMEHRAPHCSSSENYRGVLDGQGRAVFNGKVHVHPGADGTDATQSNANLLLSSRAEVDTKPELEIYADDVRCSHGATVGQLDENALFYLRSRGIALRVAKAMLTAGFAQAVVGEIDNDHLRETMTEVVRQRLATLSD